MTGRQVLGAVIVILLATAVLPPAVAWTVHQRRIARAHREAEALASNLARVLPNPLPDDPWGNPYRIVVTSLARVVLSLGPNGVLDTPPGSTAASGDDIVK